MPAPVSPTHAWTRRSPAVKPVPKKSSRRSVGALAWSEVSDDDDDFLTTEPRYDDGFVATPADSRPEVHFQHDEWEELRARYIAAW